MAATPLAMGLVFVLLCSSGAATSTDEQQLLSPAELSVQVAALSQQVQMLVAQQQPEQQAPSEVLATDFGAQGDGVHDDTAGLQAAIDHARNASLVLRFPIGKYRITHYLDWGDWAAIAVRGAEPGNAAISGGHGLVQIVADHVNGTAHDFTGCGYGFIEGIDFVGSCSGAMVLNGRTSTGGYGSDLIFRRCNFGGAAKGAFVDHMVRAFSRHGFGYSSNGVSALLPCAHVDQGEVLTWQDCKFHGHSDNGPGLVITWRADSPRWNVSAPSGRNLTKGVSVTQYRMYGGELTGDNGAMIILDMGGAPTNGGDFAAFGTYFATSGDNIAAVEIAGAWNNFILDGSRDEETDMPAHAMRGFVKLVDGASLRDFRIHGYGDGDEGGPVVRGAGSLAAGTIVTGAGGGLDLVGDVAAVDYRSANSIRLAVDGNVERSSFRQGDTRQSMTINVTGALEIDDGRGGILVHHHGLYGHGDATQWSCGGVPAPSGGLYLAEFAGDQMLVHCSLAGGRAAMSVSSHHDAARLTGNAGVGRLSIVENGTSGTAGGAVRAEMVGTGGEFTVRRVAV
jgi:hypothetical protein